MITKESIIENITREDVWDSAKHRYADMLLQEYDNEDVRTFLMDKFKKTGDYYYISIIKNKTNEER